MRDYELKNLYAAQGIDDVVRNPEAIALSIREKIKFSKDNNQWANAKKVLEQLLFW